MLNINFPKLHRIGHVHVKICRKEISLAFNPFSFAQIRAALNREPHVGISIHLQYSRIVNDRSIAD